jgi:MarR family transcriptional regulator, organic hydroperoxide resistance regulator
LSQLSEPAVTIQESDVLRVWLRFVRLQQLLSSDMSTKLREVGLSIPQFDLLSTLSEHEGATQQQLAERLYVTKGNVSGLVDRLVALGLVERRPIPDDRRSYALHLTPEGQQRALEGLAAQKAYVLETLGHLPSGDIAQLEQIVLGWRDIARARASQPVSGTEPEKL